MDSLLKILGATEYIQVADNENLIPAKIDTGADTSAIWAEVLNKKSVHDDAVLKFTLFCEESEFYDGTIYETEEFTEVKVRSSNGQSESRFLVELPVILGGIKVKAQFTLANRSKNKYPVLIGKKALAGHFLVDVRFDKAEVI